MQWHRKYSVDSLVAFAFRQCNVTPRSCRQAMCAHCKLRSSECNGNWKRCESSAAKMTFRPINLPTAIDSHFQKRSDHAFNGDITKVHRTICMNFFMWALDSTYTRTPRMVSNYGNSNENFQSGACNVIEVVPDSRSQLGLHRRRRQMSVYYFRN